MENDNKQSLIIAITIIIVTSICATWLLYSQNNKREKIETCIQQTGNEIECKCAYRDCFAKDREIIFKKLDKQK